MKNMCLDKKTKMDNGRKQLTPEQYAEKKKHDEELEAEGEAAMAELMAACGGGLHGDDDMGEDPTRTS